MVAMVNNEVTQEKPIKQEPVKTTVLKSLDEIAEFIGYSRASTLKLIREKNLPATKILRNWCSDTLLIEKWVRGLILAAEDAAKVELAQASMGVGNALAE